MRWAVLVYAGLALLGAALALATGHSPVSTPSPWVAAWGLGPVGANLLGLAGGALLGGATVAVTPLLVRRFPWARELHASLRPAVRDRSAAALVMLAVASGLSEEIFFRGMLTQLVGLVPAAIAFGLLHQVRGRARWIWVAWATGMGLALGSLFLATGSILGAAVAHVVVNAQNLRYLRDHDVEPKKPRRLGGLLGSA